MKSNEIVELSSPRRSVSAWLNSIVPEDADGSAGAKISNSSSIGSLASSRKGATHEVATIATIATIASCTRSAIGLDAHSFGLIPEV